MLVDVLIVVAVSASAITAMLVMRRGAPDGSFFHDGDRAAGVFGVLATGFAVLAGFVVFLAFDQLRHPRWALSKEALIVAQQVETAQFFAAPADQELIGELVCYARSVAGVQWDRMEDGSLGEELNPWAGEMFRTLRTVEPRTSTEQSAFDTWLSQRAGPRGGPQPSRPRSRRRDPHAAVGGVVLHVRDHLHLHAVLRRQWGAGGRAGAAHGHGGLGPSRRCCCSWACLNNPFHEGVGGLRPVAMERALKVIDEELAIAEVDAAIPCDARGNAR